MLEHNDEPDSERLRNSLTKRAFLWEAGKETMQWTAAYPTLLAATELVVVAFVRQVCPLPHGTIYLRPGDSVKCGIRTIRAYRRRMFPELHSIAIIAIVLPNEATTACYSSETEIFFRRAEGHRASGSRQEETKEASIDEVISYIQEHYDTSIACSFVLISTDRA
ncbi:hypothetical protein ABU162_21500 [Paenibacillus thiaminolyticus]|uniref:hypothetical protein n=1 Tax=Paenibacillus thiaminolyticus TaxID=49283 RepID=UPI0035A6135A